MFLKQSLYIKIFYILIIFSYFQTLYLHSKENSSMIPVLIENGSIIIEGVGDNASHQLKQKFKMTGDPDIKETTISIPQLEESSFDLEHLKTFIKRIRENICEVNSNGSYEISFQVGGTGNLVFVSTTANTGIKTIINCGPTP